MMENQEKYVEGLKEAANFVSGMEIKERLRKILHRAVMSELASQVEIMEEQIRYERQGKPFTKAEIEILKDELKDRKPMSWEEEDEIVNSLSVVLRRQKKAVKDQARKLGLESAVDYWHNTRGRVVRHE